MKYFLLLAFGFIHILCLGQAKIRVTEINYHSDTTAYAGDWVELGNMGNAAIDISNWIMTDADFNHFFVIPSGNVLDPGEFLVIAQDLALFNNQHPAVSNVVGSFGFGLKNSSDMVQVFDSQNNLYLSLTYADSLDWPEGPDGNGRTLELKSSAIDGNWSSPSSWYAGCMGGSPGSAAPVACSEPVIFTEINYNSHPDYDTGDWVEIYNRGAAPMDLSNWVFKDKNDSNAFVLPTGITLMPSAYLVIVKSYTKFKDEFNINNVVGSFPFKLNTGKETLRLFDGKGRIHTSVTYNNTYPWNVNADGQAYTLELTNFDLDPNDALSWATGCKMGSPGKFNPCPFEVKEVQEELSVNVYPNPTTDRINFSGKLDDIVRADIYDVSGRLIISERSTDKINQGIEMTGLNNGIYLVNLVGSTVHSQIVIKR